MSITKNIETTVADAEVSDEYGVTLTLTDPLTMQTVTVEVSQEEALVYAALITAKAGEAVSAYWEDRGKRPTPTRHGFDTDGPVAS